MEERRFQWLKGDKQGKIEKYKDTVRQNDIDYISFQSGARVTTDLIGDYIVELTSEGEPFINSSLFKPNTIIPNGPSPSPSPSNKAKPKSNTKSDNFSLSDLIKVQLEKNNEFISINLDIPILEKTLFKMLLDTNSDVIDDLTKIVISKYINKEDIETTIKEKMLAYYNGDATFEKTDYLNVKTETIKN